MTMRGLDVREGKARFCHAEGSEASWYSGREILRFAQDDKRRLDDFARVGVVLFH